MTRRAADSWLARRVALWSDYFSPNSSFEIISSNPGKFTPSSTCPSPSLWVLLVGHYRTFHWTQHGLEAMARLSSGDCFMVSAVMPNDLCERAEDNSHACMRPIYFSPMPWMTLNHRDFTERIEDVPKLVGAASSTFSNRLASLVVRRYGELNTYPIALYTSWHLAWAVCIWSSMRNDFTPRASSVVIRTRPDAIFNVHFELSSLARYFENGVHGKHLAVVQHSYDNPPAQTDVLLVTSFGCYASDIARPFEILD
ncbi:MAG: hypothetical protein SGPRY_006178, partial [Prymnesium sp.]